MVTKVLTISYKVKCIDTPTFMGISLSYLVDNVPEGIYRIKCKDFACFLQCETVKRNSIKYGDPS